MSEDEGELVECDKCGKQVERSKIVIDKGTDYPELIKKAKDEGKDHIELCPLCADVEMVDEEETLESELSNVRTFL